MGEAEPITSNFEIVDMEEYISCIKIQKKRYSVGRNALNASLYFKGLTKEELLINLGKDNVDDNSRRGYLTLKNIHSILCLFFYKDSKIEHKIEHVKRFLKNLKYHDNKMEDKIAFDNFITFIQPHLDTNFNQYGYTLNPTTWEFEVINIDSLPKGRINADAKKSESHIGKRKKYYKSIFLIVGIVAIVSTGYYIKTVIQNNIEQEQKILEERNIIENAKAKNNSRTILLNSIYKDINKELEDDYNNDGIRNLSESLIARIISLSEQFIPYKYLKSGKIIEQPLSPERGNLFFNLFKSNLDIETFNSIITKSNFTYSDLSDKNLSGLDLTKQLYGVAGNYNDEVQILITPLARTDFSYSDFRGANLNNTSLYGIFSYCDFRNAKLKETNIIWSKVLHSNFQGNTISECRIMNSSFNHSNFKETALRIGSSVNEGFINCDLRGVVFDGSTIYGGYNAFLFKNCFFSSIGTFFNYYIEYSIGEVLIRAQPFINGNDNYFKGGSYKILDYKTPEIGLPIYIKDPNSKEYVLQEDLEIKRLNKRKAIKTNAPFKRYSYLFFNDEKFYKRLYVSSIENNFTSIIVRTNDNLDKDKKYIKEYTSFGGAEWNAHNTKKDTVYITSSFNKLQSKYRGVVQNHKQDKNLTSNGIASFKNCKFINTHFSNSSMEFVSFNNSEFIRKKGSPIQNKFFDTQLIGNDFRIKSGEFMFSSETVFDSLTINKKFPILKFIKDKDSLKNDYKNKKLLIIDKEYDEKDFDSMNMNWSLNRQKYIIEWIEQNEPFIKLNSTNMKNGDYILKNTSIKKVF